MIQPVTKRARVIYRASAFGGFELALQLSMEATAATVADAWARLSAIRPDLDPMTLEIEIRHPPARPAPDPEATRRREIARPGAQAPIS